MIEENLQTYKPVTGVVVYKKESNFYLQVHDIIETGDKKYTWGEGKPFQREQLQELALSLKKENLSTLKLKGFLPDNVLFYQPAISGNQFIWFLPPAEYHMTFVPTLKIKARKFKMPGLILAVSDEDLYIYAYKGKERPGPKTELFNAPFYNVYEDGEVCMGTISESRKRHYLHEEIDRWERRFFGGRFTNAHGEDDRLAEKFTMKALYASLVTAKSFPEKCLKLSDKKTLEKFLTSFINKEKND